MGRSSGYLRLMRPVNCLMMGFAVIVGAAISDPSALGAVWVKLVYGFIAGYMLTAASMSINDYYDRDIDAINEPKRPIPSGLVKPNGALAFAVILTAIGFITASLTGIFCLLTAIVAWIVFVTYTIVGKRSGLPGNLLVSICVAVPFVYGNYTVASVIEPKVLVFVSMAFLSNTGREITKGIADVKGDKMQNVKTLAVSFGEKTAAVAAALFYFSAVLLSLIPWSLNFVSFWFIPFVVLTDLGFAASSFMLLKDYSRENARKVKKIVLLWFILGLLAFVIGTVR